MEMNHIFILVDRLEVHQKYLHITLLDGRSTIFIPWNTSGISNRYVLGNFYRPYDYTLKFFVYQLYTVDIVLFHIFIKFFVPSYLYLSTIRSYTHYDFSSYNLHTIFYCRRYNQHSIVYQHSFCQ